MKCFYINLKELDNYLLVHLTSVFNMLVVSLKKASVLRFLFILSFFAFAIQFSNAQEHGNNETSLKAKEKNIDQNEIKEDSPISIDTPLKNSNENRENTELEYKINNSSDTLSYTSQILRLLLSLAFVIFLAYVAIKLMKKGSFFSVNDDPYIKLVANLNIEQGKSVKVFSIGNEAYIIGVTGTSITKIDKITDKELVDAMNLKADENTEVDKKNFTKIFSNLFSSKKNTQKKDEASPIDYTFLASQQDRLKNINIQNNKSDTSE